MAIAPGTRFGAYEVVAPIGAGGMGEVYRARDTRLGRAVAIKVLPAVFADNPDRLARFEREAKTLASLNHTNIASVYGFELGDSGPALVMELIEGDTVADRILRGPIPPPAAVALALQIAEGLDAAHQRGIVHRDLKPSNVKISPDGVVKLVDFGLAKAAASSMAEVDISVSPTVTVAGLGTQAGVIMGTAAYMSPEQARGQVVDKRTDIWAFGCVLYEMLTSRCAFGRATSSDTIAAILERDVDWTVLPAATPSVVRHVIARCLDKDPRRRLRDIGDAIADLERPPVVDRSRADGRVSRRLRAAGVLGVLGVVALLAAAAWVASNRPPAVAARLSASAITPFTTEPGYEGEPTFSPDGGTIAYVTDHSGNFEIVRRQVIGGAEVNLTNHEADDVQPAFSPDGQSIAFVSSRGRPSRLKHEGYDLPLMGGAIWVMPALGGAPRRAVEDGGFPSWSPDGTTIVYSTGPAFGQKLMTVPAIGGASTEIPVRFTDGVPRFLLYPRYSGDKRWIVFETDSPVGFGPRDIYLIDAAGGDARRIARGQQPLWSADSQSIIFSNGAPGANYSLWQIPFSPTGQTGEAVPLTVGRGRDAQPAITRDGKLLAFAGVEFSFSAELVSLDVDGKVSGVATPVTRGNSVTYFQSFSPDGRSIVYESRLGTASHLWRVDPPGSPMQLTADPAFEDTFPRWSPRDSVIAFSRRSLSGPASVGIWLIASDGGSPRQLVQNAGFFAWLGSGRGLVYFSRADRQIYLHTLADNQTRKLTDEPDIVQVMSVSRDDRWLVYQTLAAGNSDLRALPIDGGAARTILATPDHDYHPVVTSTGRWIYYQKNHENFYRIPGPAQDFRVAPPEQITHFPESGLLLDDPQLSADGRQLLYSRGRRASDIWLVTLER